MKSFFTALLLFFIFTTSYAQIAKDIMVGGGVDLIKTDLSGFFQKLQTGVEVNYFLSRDFTATGGLEIWTYDKPSAVIGGRWYPSEVWFVRARGLIGTNDLSIGAGWCKPLTENLRFEAIGDFYFRIEFSARVGIAYVLRMK
jgi:hypothetical protein